MSASITNNWHFSCITQPTFIRRDTSNTFQTLYPSSAVQGTAPFAQYRSPLISIMQMKKLHFTRAIGGSLINTCMCRISSFIFPRPRDPAAQIKGLRYNTRFSGLALLLTSGVDVSVSGMRGLAVFSTQSNLKDVEVSPSGTRLQPQC